MQAKDDGSVVLTAAEAREVSKVLRLGRELAEQMDAVEQSGHASIGVTGSVELQLLEAIELLEELGVSPEELTEKLDSRNTPR
jgi:hypothetical protein